MAARRSQPAEVAAAARRSCSAIPLVANNRSIGWISDRVAGVAEGKTPLWWWVCFRSQRACCWHAWFHAHLPDFHRRRCLGYHASGHVGLGHHQFRVVDRYRPRRNADFGDSLSAAPTLAHRRSIAPRKR